MDSVVGAEARAARDLEGGKTTKSTKDTKGYPDGRGVSGSTVRGQFVLEGAGGGRSHWEPEVASPLPRAASSGSDHEGGKGHEALLFVLFVSFVVLPLR